MVTADYYYPDWVRLVDFFLQSGVEKLLAWTAGDWTHNPLDLCSQSGAYDLSATATPSIYVESANGKEAYDKTTSYQEN